jgi:hypothetical protein
LLTESISFHVFITFQTFDVHINACLRLDVFDVSATEIDAGFSFNYLGFLKGNLALVLFNVDVREGHVFVEIFDLVLDLEDFLLALLLLP